MKKWSRVKLTIEAHHVSAGTVSRHSISGTVLSITNIGNIKVQFDENPTDREVRHYAGRTMSHSLDIWNSGGSRLEVMQFTKEVAR